MVRLPADTPEFTQAAALRTLCIDAAGLRIDCRRRRFHQFEPQGVTGTVLLAESHIAIHMARSGFRHRGRVRVQPADRQHAKAEHVFRVLETALRPQRTRFQAIHRGGKDA
jgi:S-adenosylmethionine/arginine decarboxylase-like enzyme